jgi:hypothetical protein
MRPPVVRRNASTSSSMRVRVRRWRFWVMEYATSSMEP